MKLKMDKSVIGDSLTKEYGIPENYRIFRHIFYHKGKEIPEALFMIKFQLKRMNPKLNVLFSYIPMMVLIHMKGFREKYYLTDYQTGCCRGVYKWQTVADAENYSQSVAVKFMKKRSVAGSVHFKIIKENQVICEC